MSEFLTNQIQRKFRLICLIVAVGVIGIVVVHGWSWMIFAVSATALAVLAFGIISVSFWIWVFRNTGRSQDNP